MTTSAKAQDNLKNDFAPILAALNAETAVKKRKETRRILDETVIFTIKVAKTTMVKKLKKAEKELLVARAQETKKTGAKGETAIYEGEAENLAHLRMSKDLIDLTAMRPIRALDAQFKAMLKAIEIETALTGAGRHLVPLVYVNTIVGRTKDYIEAREKLVEDFVAQFPALKREQIELDPQLYSESDYPSMDDVKAGFFVEWGLTAEDVPTKLNRVSSEVFSQEMAKAEEKWSGVGDDLVNGLRQGLAVLIENAVDQLATVDGKPKTFRDSCVTKIQQFIEFFPGRALVPDSVVKQQVDDLQKALAGIAPQQLRDDMDLRAKAFEAIQHASQVLQREGITAGNKRRLRINEGDEDDDE